MRVNISTLLKANGNSLSVSLNGVPDLCVDLYEDVQRFNSLTLQGTLVNLSGVLLFKGQLSFSYVARCGRCLGDVSEEHTIDVEGSFAGSASDSEDSEYFYTGNELDFSKFIFDNVALDIPAKHLCSDDCKGLCPKCGKNLNIEECSCKVE